LLRPKCSIVEVYLFGTVAEFLVLQIGHIRNNYLLANKNNLSQKSSLQRNLTLDNTLTHSDSSYNSDESLFHSPTFGIQKDDMPLCFDVKLETLYQSIAH